MPRLLLTTMLFVILTNYSAISQGNYALQFNGSNELDCGTSTHTNITGTALTVEAWIYPTSFTTNYWEGTIVGREGGDVTGYVLRCGGSGILSFVIAIPGSTWIEVKTAGTVLTANIWQHVAGIYNGSTMKIYVDGKEVASTSETRSVVSSTVHLLVGASPIDASHTRKFFGKIDDVRIWNVARTITELNVGMFRTISTGSNLKAWYKLDDGTGTTTADASGNGNTGTLVSSPSWVFSPGGAGAKKALSFDATDDYVDCGIPAGTQITNNVTIMGWFKPGATAGWEDIITNQWKIWASGIIIAVWGPTGDLHYAVCGPGGTPVSRTITTPSTMDGKWHHVAFTFSSGTVNIYLDGILKDSYNTGLASIQYDGIHHLYIGKDSGTGLEQWNGQLDEVSIWSQVLTADQIREAMMHNMQGSESGLAAYYRFDHPGSSILYDLGPNGIHGTLTNMDPATEWVSSTAFNSWTGTVSTSWSSTANWSNDAVPSSGDNIGIYKLTGAYDCQVGSTPTLGHAMISSTSSPTLGSSMTVNGNLLLERNLDLNGQTITLGTSAYLVEGSYRLYGSSGSITTTRTLSNISGLDVAGLGAVITTAANMGSTVISRAHSAHHTSILRYYTITPTNNSGLNATLAFTYNDNELNGLTESTLGLFRSTDGVSWTKKNGTVNTTSNTITLSAIDAFSLWTAGLATSFLPVRWLDFTVADVHGSAVIHWSTANEENTAFCTVQHSLNGMDWADLYSIPAAGNSNSLRSYSFTHVTPPLGMHYYRIRMSDLDGQLSYSMIRSLAFGTDGALPKIFPNPVTGGKMTIQMPADGQAFIYDGSGSLYKSLNLVKGISTIDVTALPRGAYWLKYGNVMLRFLKD